MAISQQNLLNMLIYIKIYQQNQKMIKQQKPAKQDKSTISQEQDKSNQSTINLIKSGQLTLQMAIQYLFLWRKNDKVLIPLLEKIYFFFKQGYYNHLPTTMYKNLLSSFIMSLQRNDQLQNFCQKLAKQSLVFYLLLRWSYSTYYQQLQMEKLKNKLDNWIFTKNTQEQFEGGIQILKKLIQKKQKLLNYSIKLNDYYERIFAVPQKLKKYKKQERNQILKARLEKIQTKFFENDNTYYNGILLPLQKRSCIAVKVLFEHCFTFSTKQRVPFKIVFETISESDAKSMNPFFDQEKKQEEYFEPITKKKQSLLLPQSYFGIEWNKLKQKIAQKSQYSHFQSYEIQSFIIKSGDDLRQQCMAMQLIKMVQQICKQENVKIWLRTYSVIPFDASSGLIQFIDDTKTVSYLKQKSSATSLKQIYKQIFGQNWQVSLSNFVESLAGYSLVTYLFNIKDRHNNNILIDNYGHIIHIDFSFIIGVSPGNVNFQRAPFKLTKDYIDLMEGEQSDIFKHFKLLFFFGLKYIRKYKRQIMNMINIMTHCKGMKCFDKFDRQSLQKRFYQNATDQQLTKIVDNIIYDAIHARTTNHYDYFQWFSNQITY